MAALLGGGVVIVLLVLQFVILPFLASKRSAQQAINTNEKTLADMMLLAAEYQGLRIKAEKIQQVLARRPQDFNLFSHLEKMAGAAGIKSTIKSISAAKGTISGPYEEQPVEIRLEKVTLKQLTDFLYLIESPQDLIRIKTIAITKMKESPEYLATQILVVTYQLSKVAGR
jgi:general secretion pathway protein M